MPDVQLSPAQTTARELLHRALAISPVLCLWAETGRGKTTVLRHLHDEIGGAFLSIQDILNSMLEQHPLSIEERLFELVRNAIKDHQTVILDDFELVNTAFCCHHTYPRLRWLEAPALALCDDAAKNGKTLIFSHGGMSPQSIQERAISGAIPRFRVEDYEALVRTWLGERGSKLDFAKI